MGSVATVELICSTLVLLTSSITIFVLFIKLFIKIRNALQEKVPFAMKDKLLCILSIISLGFYGLACFISSIVLICVLILNTHNHNILQILYWIVGGLFYIFGQWLLLFIFVIRTDVTFKALNIPLFIQFNPLCIKIYYIFVISLIILLIGIFVCIAINDRDLSILFASIWALFNLILSISLIISFLKKIFDVMEYKASHILIQNDIDDTKQSHSVIINFDDIKSITRYGLLVTLAICSTFSSFIIIIIITQNYNYNNEQELGTLEYLFVGLDAFINALCVYLLFEFNQNLYFKLCGKGHIFCQNCCIKCVASKLGQGDIEDDNVEPIDYEELILR